MTDTDTTCPSCGQANAEDAKFCAQCGTGLAPACPACGSAVERSHRFCQNCGGRLPWADGAPPKPAPANVPDREGERRQVTVLFGDLTGFTGLSSGLDPEATHDLLNRYFARVDGIIRSYGGTIDKHIGDGVMAVFGAPVAHSDDPERALRAAIDIHAALAAFDPPLSAHVGVASGTVVASGTGSDDHREYTVIGDSVNLAARLQDRAAADETLISGEVRAAVGRRFDCEPLGELAIRGLSEPVEAWRLLGLGGSAENDTPRPFVGRRTEIAQFAGALDACLAQGSGQTILVRGEPGIGKTRLLEEYRRLAVARGFDWHAGLVLDFGSGRGMGAIPTVVRALVGLADGGAHETFGGAVGGAVGEALARGGLAEEQRVFLNDLLDIDQPTDLRSLYDAMDDTTRTEGRERVVCDLARNAAARTPVVVAIEDVHWADPATLAHLARLAGASATSRFLLLMTSRIEGDPIDAAWRAAAAGAPLMTIDLGPLREADALAYAQDFFSATESFAQNCVKRAGGNPLFLEQLLRSAEEASDSKIPGSVQSIVLARMDNLDPADRRAVRAASVLGQRFSSDALRHLIDRPDYDCRALIRHFLIRPEGDGFLFAHALVRDGIYSSLLKSQRRELHRRAADWYARHDRALRAEHLDRAEDPGAAAAYLAAAEEEAQSYRNESALRLSERALALAGDAERHAACCFRGDLLRGLGEVEGSIEAFESALSAARDDAERSRAWIGLAEGLRVSDRPSEALDALDTAESAAASGPPLALAEIHHLRGNLYFPMGRVEDCLAEHELARRFAHEAGSREWEARALGGLGDASYLAGRMSTACRHFRDCVALCRELGLGRIEVANRHMVGWSRMYLNEIAEACEDGRAAAELAQTVGQNRAEMLGHILAGYMYYEQLILDRAAEEAETATAVARRLGAGNFIAQSLSIRALIALAEGRRADARGHVDGAFAVLEETGMSFFGPFAHGTAALVTEDPEERARHLVDAEEILAKGCVSHNYFWFYRAAIDASLDGGNWTEAERYAAALSDYTRGEPLPWSELFAARGRALARFGRGDREAGLRQELSRIAASLEEAGLRAHLAPVATALAAF